MYRASRSAALVAAVLLATSALADSYVGWAAPRSLNEVVSTSKIIFAGTVAQVKHGKNQRGGEFTTVTFERVVFVKGARDAHVVLTLPANRDDHALELRGVIEPSPITPDPKSLARAEASGSFLNGVPVFREDSRYVVLAAEWGNPQEGHLPIILHEGVFSVRERAGGTYVMDSEGRPLVGIEDGCLGVVDSTFGANMRTKDTARVVSTNGSAVASEAYYPDSLFTKSHVVMGYDGLPKLRIYPMRADTGERLTETAFLDALGRLKKDN